MNTNFIVIGVFLVLIVCSVIFVLVGNKRNRSQASASSRPRRNTISEGDLGGENAQGESQELPGFDMSKPLFMTPPERFLTFYLDFDAQGQTFDDVRMHLEDLNLIYRERYKVFFRPLPAETSGLYASFLIADGFSGGLQPTQEEGYNTIRSLVLFMPLPGESDSYQVLDDMLDVGLRLAKLFGAVLRTDDEHEILSSDSQLLRRYRDSIERHNSNAQAEPDEIDEGDDNDNYNDSVIEVPSSE